MLAKDYYPFNPHKLISNIQYINNLRVLVSHYERQCRKKVGKKNNILDEEEILALPEEENVG